MKNSIYIIAEAGVNHNGDMTMAREMIDVAACAGADAVKFQTFRAEQLAVYAAPKAEYQKLTTHCEESQFEMLKRLELSHESHSELMAYCQEKRIDFLSTAFDTYSARFLYSLGLKTFKIPSGEITNTLLLQEIGRYDLNVILSTGMSTLEEVQNAVSILVRAGTDKDQIILLHCTTAYPTPFEDVNLRAILTMKNELNIRVGYSDHTAGIEVPIAATALGAVVLEKHFTLDRSLPGPDHQASIEPDELVAMIKAVRHIEIALGDGIKQCRDSETANKSIARKSIVAARPINAGERYTKENLAIKRPGTGISPMEWNQVINTLSNRSYRVDELIER